MYANFSYVYFVTPLYAHYPQLVKPKLKNKKNIKTIKNGERLIKVLKYYYKNQRDEGFKYS